MNLKDTVNKSFRKFYYLYRQRMDERVRSLKQMDKEKQKEMVKLYSTLRNKVVQQVTG